nr:MAG: hypothetical protein [Drosophila-associated Gosford narnavirus]
MRDAIVSLWCCGTTAHSSQKNIKLCETKVSSSDTLKSIDSSSLGYVFNKCLLRHMTMRSSPTSEPMAGICFWNMRKVYSCAKVSMTLVMGSPMSQPRSFIQ